MPIDLIRSISSGRQSIESACSPWLLRWGCANRSYSQFLWSNWIAIWSIFYLWFNPKAPLWALIRDALKERLPIHNHRFNQSIRSIHPTMISSNRWFYPIDDFILSVSSYPIDAFERDTLINLSDRSIRRWVHPIDDSILRWLHPIYSVNVAPHFLNLWTLLLMGNSIDVRFPYQGDQFQF